MRVENLNGYPNQFLIVDYENDSISFQSYKTLIATLKRGTLKVFSHWDYSNTTMRHFKRFINEETPFTYENSKQWRQEMKDNPQIEEVL